MILCKPLISQWKTWGYLRLYPIFFLLSTARARSGQSRRREVRSLHHFFGCRDQADGVWRFIRLPGSSKVT
ncbi:hypothetical protein [Xanthomonas graminis]|jgi:hypothetical protein|uniref:hypothetical protein n=1 Tax=Xanthomonas graminis TaxID=3390026 RepID=UPI0025434F94|nr:hypothetical protein [Xanthomonas translucens]